MVKVEKTRVDYLFGILHKFEITSWLIINWHKSVAYCCVDDDHLGGHS